MPFGKALNYTVPKLPHTKTPLTRSTPTLQTTGASPRRPVRCATVPLHVQLYANLEYAALRPTSLCALIPSLRPERPCIEPFLEGTQRPAPATLPTNRNDRPLTSTPPNLQNRTPSTSDHPLNSRTQTEPLKSKTVRRSYPRIPLIGRVTCGWVLPPLL